MNHLPMRGRLGFVLTCVVAMAGVIAAGVRGAERQSDRPHADESWWSFQPLRDVTPPKVDSVDSTDWPRNEIDHFILNRLAQAGLSPSKPADARTLIRRVYYDLIGLPPSPQEVDAFVKDPSDAAYTEVVDHLLALPQYGERWGRHWLDVARFGESDGFERNGPRKNSWRYRDWVIDAFNQDMPYDRFARMQIAGDLLDAGPEGVEAAGFLVAGVHNTVVGSSERMKKLARQDELEEIAGNVGQTFLGLTVNCARCHDHKFDPIKSKEYYQLISALDGVNHGEREVALGDSAAELARTNDEIAQLRKQINRIEDDARKQVLAARDGEGAVHRDLPKPCDTWEFEGDLRDSVGSLHGEAKGSAHVEAGGLVLDGGDAYVQTLPLERDLTEKTLEAWVLLDDLDQRGGGVIGVQTLDGGVFDDIVFGEREPKKWMAGSDSFRRTKSFEGAEEDVANTQPVHVAIVYHADGRIIAYRNGVPYGQSYQTDLIRFEAGKSRIVFGMRHAPPGGNKMLKGRILRANLYDHALDDSAVAASAGVESDYVSEDSIVRSLSDNQRAQRVELKVSLATAEKRQGELEALANTKLYSVVSGEPGPMRVHIRGGITDLGDEVTPGGVAAVIGVNADFGIPADAPDQQRRTHLAQWITDRNNPLFSRVMANRVWHYHFGAGLIETPNDLGFNGGQPSHPDLLDWLASRFRANGFHLKPLHRMIVLSSTYRQRSSGNAMAAKKDANNRLLWRFSPKRMEAEVIRDSLLQIAGMMDPAMGGPGFEDVTITYNNGTTYYEPVDRVGADFSRRTIYRFTPRGGRSALLDSFDCPDPSAATPRRSVTTTPLQALSLLNDSFVLRMADSLAQRVKRDEPSNADEQARSAWRLVLQRYPDDEEQRLAAQLASKHGLAALCRALFNMNEFMIIE